MLICRPWWSETVGTKVERVREVQSGVFGPIWPRGAQKGPNGPKIVIFISINNMIIMVNLKSEWETRVAMRMEIRAAKKLTLPHLKINTIIIIGPTKDKQHHHYLPHLR